MTDRKPNEPSPQDFKETARKSREAGIADENATYVEAMETTGNGNTDDAEAHPS